MIYDFGVIRELQLINFYSTSILILCVNHAKADRKFLDVVDFGEGTCSETEDCKSALQYCLKPGFGFDAEPTQVRLQFPGFVGECEYHQWFIITAALLGTLFGLGVITCFFSYCMKVCHKHRERRNNIGIAENGNGDFHMIPGSVKSLVQMYNEK